MTRALSNDLRERVIGVVASGLSRRAAAERFGIAVSTAVRWVRGWRESGSAAPRRQGGDRRSHRIEAHADELLALIAKTPDITLQELAGHLRKAHGLRVVESTVWRFLDRHGMTFKKNRARQRAAKA
jgi:transposase